MTFLAPWAMVLGVVGAAGIALLHLVARHRPAAWLMPTARFIPDRQSLVSRAATRPRDLLLLALRMLLLVVAGAAFAQPVFVTNRATRARIVLLDRSDAVADPAAAFGRARALTDSVPASKLIAFDTSVRVLGKSDLESARNNSVARRASLTAGLILARREAGMLAQKADSVELVIVSPVASGELDAGTWAVRSLWPGSIRVERVAARASTTLPPTLEREVPLSDVLGPALSRTSVHATSTAIRVRHSSQASSADSSFARAGGTVVLWDSAGAPLSASALAMGDDVFVAPLGRRGLDGAGAVAVRWADGSPASRDAPIGSGCLRTVGIVVPAAGDVALRPMFQRIVRGLVSPCDAASDLTPASDSVMRRLRGGGALAPASSLASDSRSPSPVVPWLFGAALACGILELALRRRPSTEVTA